MTLNFKVYCNKKPDVKRLVGTIEGRYWGMHNNEHAISWGINQDDISIYIPAEASHFQRDYELKDISQRLVVAGKEILPEIKNKMKRDADALAQFRGSYLFVADEEMYSLLLKHPSLEHDLREMNEGIQTTKHSKGQKIYQVRFETWSSSMPECIGRIGALASYIAKENNGIIYNPQKSEFGNINPDSALSSRSFALNVFELLAIDNGRLFDELLKNK